jgi:hypothetical protein
MEISTIVMADSLEKAHSDVEDETYGWSDYSIDNDAMINIFDIDFVKEVDENSMLEQEKKPHMGEYDISSLTQESLKAIIIEAYERGLNERI